MVKTRPLIHTAKKLKHYLSIVRYLFTTLQFIILFKYWAKLQNFVIEDNWILQTFDTDEQTQTFWESEHKIRGSHYFKYFRFRFDPGMPKGGG